MCNDLKCQQINDIIGPGSSSNLMDPERLYFSNSETVNKIARLLCEKQCYFDPGECFFDDNHTFNFKNLMRKDLHDRLNPTFLNILNEDTKEDVVLKYDVRNHPKVYELCDEIGFTTDIVYNKDGFVDLNYDLFCKQLWDHDTPLFVLEEKKVLDIFWPSLLLLQSYIQVRELKYLKSMPKTCPVLTNLSYQLCAITQK